MQGYSSCYCCIELRVWLDSVFAFDIRWGLRHQPAPGLWIVKVAQSRRCLWDAHFGLDPQKIPNRISRNWIGKAEKPRLSRLSRRRWFQHQESLSYLICPNSYSISKPANLIELRTKLLWLSSASKTKEQIAYQQWVVRLEANDYLRESLNSWDVPTVDSVTVRLLGWHG